MKAYTEMPKSTGNPPILTGEGDTPLFSPIAMCTIARMIMIANAAREGKSDQLRITNNYSNFRVSCLECTLHTVINHKIVVLEWQSLTSKSETTVTNTHIVQSATK